MSEIYDYRKFDWFAWYPVRTENGGWTWLRTVSCYAAETKPGYHAGNRYEYWTKPENRTLAEQATKGPWLSGDMGHDNQAIVIDETTRTPIGIIHPRVDTPDGAPFLDQALANAAYIAACSPDVLLAQLDEIDRLRAALRDCVEVLELDGTPESLRPQVARAQALLEGK